MFGNNLGVYLGPSEFLVSILGLVDFSLCLGGLSLRIWEVNFCSGSKFFAYCELMLGMKKSI